MHWTLVIMTTVSNAADDWQDLREYNTALSILDPQSKKHKGWFDENDTKMRQPPQQIMQHIEHG